MSAPELLNIKQAAALLQVSQASLRRWTDAGKLACFRVGGRRERRFRRVDLLGFLDSHSARARRVPAVAESHVATGHLCGLYASDLARSRQAVGFLADCSGVGNVCFLVMAPGVRDRVVATLERRRPSLRSDIDAGRFVVAEYADAAGLQLEFWESQFAAALRAGAHSLHVVGDLSGGPLGQPDRFEEVLEYEVEFERSISQRFPVTTLCQYDARALTGLETARLLRVHGDAFRYPAEALMT
jgi:transcriptional repressor of dcmA and dcmR